MSVVLMYHALYSDEQDLQRISVDDRPYAVSLAEFTSQMKMVADTGHGTLEQQMDRLPHLLVTFDDGHISNVEHALPILQELGIRAYFFVTTDYIGKRADFCNWDDLQKLIDSDMIVGSHGISHKFFNDMSLAEMRLELSESKRLIEEKLGNTVTSISFPGGRYTTDTLQLARELGYQQLFGSDFGQFQLSTIEHPRKSIQRVPIRRSTSLSTFSSLIRSDSQLFVVESLKARAKQLVKQLLGNRIYHGLYSALAKKH